MNRLFDMSPEFQDNLLVSLSNLAVLKMFHEHGVYVNDYPDYRAVMEYSQDEGPYIAESGLTKLFQSECSISGMYFSETEEENEIINELKNDGYVKYAPEFCFLIPLDNYHLFLNKKENLDKLQDIIFHLNENEQGFQFIYLGDRRILAITMDYEGDFHLIVKGGLTVWRELEKMNY